MRRCVLICTHRPAPGRSGLFYRFLDSIRDQAMPSDTVLAASVLLQGCDRVPKEVAERIGDNPHVTVSCSRELLASSHARNLALAAKCVTDADVVLFPDDDCWYPAGALRQLVETMRAHDSELLFVWYGDSPVVGEAARLAQFATPTATEVMRRTGMITVAMAGRVVKAIGGLDERIGLGTDLPGGEDTDYAYRAYKVARAPLMTRAPLVGHRPLAEDWATRIKVMPRYWPGLMFQTLKHIEPRLLPLVLYRCGVGLALVAMRRMTAIELARPFARCFSMRHAASEPAVGTEP